MFTLSILAFLTFSSLHATLLTPTASNSSGQYFLSSVINDFQYDSIICTASKDCIIDCFHIKSCEGLSINTNGANKLTITCSNYQACASMTINSTMNKLSLRCQTMFACQNMQIHTKNLSFGLIMCSSTYACKAAVFDIQNSSIVISCLYQQSCYNAQFNIDYSIGAFIICDSTLLGGSAATSYSYGACYLANTSARYVNYVSIYCENYDCYGSIYNFSGSTFVGIIGANYALHSSIIVATNVERFYLTCRGSYACYSAEIYGYNVTNFTIECIGTSACQYSQIYCPTNYACNTNCSGSNACYAADFYIVGNSYRNFELSCGTYSDTACVDVSVNCIGTANVTTWEWDSTRGGWGCNGDFDCCPPLQNITTTTTTIVDDDDGISGSGGLFEINLASLSIYVFAGIGLIVVCVIIICIFCCCKKRKNVQFVAPQVSSVVPAVSSPAMINSGQQNVEPVVYVAVGASTAVMDNTANFGGIFVGSNTLYSDAPYAKNSGDMNMMPVISSSAPVASENVEMVYTMQ